MTSSSAAACGRRWSFWPKRFRSPNLPKASLRVFSLPIRTVSGPKTDLSFHHVFLSPSRRADTIDQDLKQVGATVSGAPAPAACCGAWRSVPARCGVQCRFAARRSQHIRRRFCPAGFFRRTGAMAGTCRLDVRTALRFRHGSQPWQRAAAGCGQGSGRPGMGQCTAERSRAEAVPLAAGSIRNHG